MDFKQLLYPNPTTNNIFIHFTAQGNKQIIIYSIEGKQVATYFSDNNEITIDIRSFAEGTYIVKVITEKEVQTAKFIKQ
ncbi:MAG: T9SS type A sorting domain-containing protein [Vicingaceae bacterium]|nr:T9SS type A sorting domain-containing protein [Vicingaceae bacterium]